MLPNMGNPAYDDSIRRLDELLRNVTEMSQGKRRGSTAPGTMADALLGSLVDQRGAMGQQLANRNMRSYGGMGLTPRDASAQTAGRLAPEDQERIAKALMSDPYRQAAGNATGPGWSISTAVPNPQPQAPQGPTGSARAQEFLSQLPGRAAYGSNLIDTPQGRQMVSGRAVEALQGMGAGGNKRADDLLFALSEGMATPQVLRESGQAATGAWRSPQGETYQAMLARLADQKQERKGAQTANREAFQEQQYQNSPEGRMRQYMIDMAQASREVPEDDAAQRGAVMVKAADTLASSNPQMAQRLAEMGSQLLMGQSAMGAMPDVTTPPMKGVEVVDPETNKPKPKSQMKNDLVAAVEYGHLTSSEALKKAQEYDVQTPVDVRKPRGLTLTDELQEELTRRKKAVQEIDDVVNRKWRIGANFPFEKLLSSFLGDDQ